MNYRRVGNAGLKVSSVSLGAWLTYGGSVESEAAAQCIHTAIEQGVNFIDVADAYAKGEAEKVVGQAIKAHKRSDLVVNAAFLDFVVQVHQPSWGGCGPAGQRHSSQHTPHAAACAGKLPARKLMDRVPVNHLQH